MSNNNNTRNGRKLVVSENNSHQETNSVRQIKTIYNEVQKSPRAHSPKNNSPKDSSVLSNSGFAQNLREQVNQSRSREGSASPSNQQHPPTTVVNLKINNSATFAGSSAVKLQLMSPKLQQQQRLQQQQQQQQQQQPNQSAQVFNFADGNLDQIQKRYEKEEDTNKKTQIFVQYVKLYCQREQQQTLLSMAQEQVYCQDEVLKNNLYQQGLEFNATHTNITYCEIVHDLLALHRSACKKFENKIEDLEQRLKEYQQNDEQNSNNRNFMLQSQNQELKKQSTTIRNFQDDLRRCNQRLEETQRQLADLRDQKQKTELLYTTQLQILLEEKGNLEKANSQQTKIQSEIVAPKNQDFEIHIQIKDKEIDSLKQQIQQKNSLLEQLQNKIQYLDERLESNEDGQQSEILKLQKKLKILELTVKKQEQELKSKGAILQLFVTKQNQLQENKRIEYKILMPLFEQLEILFDCAQSSSYVNMIIDDRIKYLFEQTEKLIKDRQVQLKHLHALEAKVQEFEKDKRMYSRRGSRMQIGGDDLGPQIHLLEKQRSRRESRRGSLAHKLSHSETRRDLETSTNMQHTLDGDTSIDQLHNTSSAKLNLSRRESKIMRSSNKALTAKNLKKLKQNSLSKSKNKDRSLSRQDSQESILSKKFDQNGLKNTAKQLRRDSRISSSNSRQSMLSQRNSIANRSSQVLKTALKNQIAANKNTENKQKSSALKIKIPNRDTQDKNQNFSSDTPRSQASSGQRPSIKRTSIKQSNFATDSKNKLQQNSKASTINAKTDTKH